MRRCVLVVVTLLGGLLLLGAAACAKATPAPPAPPVVGPAPVNVFITCAGEHVDYFQIRPYTAVLSKARRDSVEFRLVGNSPDGLTVHVRPKDGETWPFEGQPPSFSKGQPGATGEIRSNADVKLYGYDFVFTCGEDEDVIDPRMDIRP